VQQNADVSCTRRNRTCDYSDFRAPKWTVSGPDPPIVCPRSQTVPRLVQDKDLRHFQTPSYASRSVDESGFPAVFFLDTRLFLQAQLEIPRAELPIPRHVHDLIGDAASIKDMAQRFFKTTHSWLPILSKRRFYECLLNPLLQPRPDIALLLLSIRLITIPPLSDIPTSKTPVYLAAKQFYSEVVAVGTCSIQVLQAGILISLYELSHALYPSAYLSIASCARYGVAFGINGKGPSQPKFSLNWNWDEAEERRRSWWAVLILDRLRALLFFERGLLLTPIDLLTLVIQHACWQLRSHKHRRFFLLMTRHGTTMYVAGNLPDTEHCT
jgi:hypothetical protein